jgi:GNAT superfamily N-acetyltransferase
LWRRAAPGAVIVMAIHRRALGRALGAATGPAAWVVVVAVIVLGKSSGGGEKTGQSGRSDKLFHLSDLPGSCGNVLRWALVPFTRDAPRPYSTAMTALRIRPAEKDDCALIWALLRELAAYEKLLDKFTIDAAQLAQDFFGPKPAAVCDLAFYGEEPAGLATYYWTYSSFTAARGLFVEDLFVRPASRGRGHGKALLKHLANKAAAHGAVRLEWRVLDWNEPAIDFYKSIGAQPLPDWQNWRLESQAMRKLGQ